MIDVATTADAPSYVDELRDDAEQLQRLGQDARWLDADAMRAEVDSPTYVGGLWRIGRAALVDPGPPGVGAEGGRRAARRADLRGHEGDRASIATASACVVETPLADIRAARVALATNAFKPLLRRLRHYIVPVYDYCMVTEPLTAEQLARIGWRNRQGLSDIANQFHYYRLTEDNRILWGGYDAVYFWRGRGGGRAGEPAGDVGDAEPALLQDVPAARRRPLQPHLGRGDRHVQPVLRVLGDGHSRDGSPTPSATPASAWRRPGSAPR